MAKLKFRVQGGKIVSPTDAERIADALAEVKAGLEHIDNPRVWGGYPDGWPDNDREDEAGAPQGLFLKLERCTRGNQTSQMAWAIEIAFSLGKIAEGGEATEKMAARIRADDDRRRKANARSIETRTATKEAWFDVMEPLYHRHRAVARSHPDWMPLKTFTGTVAREIKKTLGREVKELRILDVLKGKP